MGSVKDLKIFSPAYENRSGAGHFIFSDKEHFVGNARSQIGKVQKLVNDMVSEYQKQADYEGQKIR